MDQERQRIQEDLRGIVSGEVRCDDLFLEIYSSGAGLLHARPLGVVRPRSTADVAACLRYAAEEKIPVTPRGGGTNYGGRSYGRGLIIDFSRGMRRVLAVESDRVRVQAGVVYSRLQSQLRPSGRRATLHSAMNQISTVGGIIATGASSIRSPAGDAAGEEILSLEVALADGTVVEVNLGRMEAPAEESDERPEDRRFRELANAVRALRDPLDGDLEPTQGPEDSLSQHSPSKRDRGHSHKLSEPWGHRSPLAGMLNNEPFNPVRLWIGSEGTLGLITEATLCTVPQPRHAGVALLLFHSLDAASRAALEMLPLEPFACDLLDRRHLSLARECDVRFELLVPREVEAAILVGFEGDRPHGVLDRLEASIAAVDGSRPPAHAHTTLDPDDVLLFWQLARRYVPLSTGRPAGGSQAVPYLEQVAVPTEVLPDALAVLQNLLKQNHVTASLHAHADRGELHVRPFVDLANADEVARLVRLADALREAIDRMGGAVGGPLGHSAASVPFAWQRCRTSAARFHTVKRILDPQHLLNPPNNASIELQTPDGTLSAETGGVPTTPGESADDSAPKLSSPAVSPVPLQMAWSLEQRAAEVAQCSSCGICRTQALGERMCPIFRISPREEASPRAKANLLRGLLSRRLDGELLAGDDLKQIADLCVHCHMCRLECPTRVDIPRMMAEVKAAYVATNGLPPSDRLLARIDMLCAVGRAVRPVANWAIGNRQARWLLERVTGIAHGRKLPRFARHTFMHRAARRRLTRPARAAGNKVVYFVDTYANYFDVELAEAVVAVLEHNGVSVHVDPNLKASAMTLIAAGSLDTARKLAAAQVERLAEAIRRGYDVVASEPSATLCLTREYPQLLGDDDSKLVAEHTRDVGHYLWQLHQRGRLRLDFQRQPYDLAYHAPCHLLALDVGTPGENLLRLVPGLTVRRLEKGCSGMAGTYGLKRQNYRSSLRAGWELISALRESTALAGTTECCTCKFQMEQATSKPTVHPLKILALAYGRMPHVVQRLATPGEELVVT